MKGANLAKLTLAAAAGAGAAYVCDPVRGRRRRAELRDRGRAAFRHELRTIERQASYRKGRAAGRVHRLTHRHGSPPDDDRALADKVRSEVLGRMVGGPHLTLDVNEGVVTLRGQLPGRPAADDVVRAVRSVPGVVDVVDLLHEPGTPAPNKQDALNAGMPH